MPAARTYPGVYIHQVSSGVPCRSPFVVDGTVTVRYQART